MKKILWLFSFSGFLLLLLAAPVFAAGIGDINEDGVVSAVDARLALRFAVSLQTPTDRQRLPADADHDGRLTAADARLILRVAVELEDFIHPFDRADHTVTVVTAPTCAGPGVQRVTCVCGAYREETLPKLSTHSFSDEWEEQTPPSCETAGEKISVCTVCGQIRTAPIAPLGHAYTEEETKATCVTEGMVQAVCVRCGTVAARRTLPPLGHTLTEEVTLDPTCIDPGEQTVSCENCDYTVWAILPPLGHTFAEDYTEEKAPGCIEAGIRSRKCIRCAAVTDSVAVPPLGHTFEETARVAPTCTEAGSTRFVCVRCGLEKEEIVPALGHDFVVSGKTGPTCTQGEFTLFLCSRCGAEMKNGELPATGRDYSET